MSELVGALVDALVAADREEAERMVDDLAVRLESAELYGQLLAPAMREVGERWNRNEISVAEEHIASGLMEELLARDSLRGSMRPRRSRETIVLSCLQGERHLLGLRMCGNLLESAGFRVIFLGADVGHAEIAAAAEDHRASVVVVAAYGRSAGDRATDLVQRLRQAGTGCPIVIGGSAALWPEALSDVPGISIVGDLAAIVGTVETLVASDADAPAGPREAGPPA